MLVIRGFARPAPPMVAGRPLPRGYRSATAAGRHGSMRPQRGLAGAGWVPTGGRRRRRRRPREPGRNRESSISRPADRDSRALAPPALPAHHPCVVSPPRSEPPPLCRGFIPDGVHARGSRDQPLTTPPGRATIAPPRFFPHVLARIGNTPGSRTTYRGSDGCPPNRPSLTTGPAPTPPHAAAAVRHGSRSKRKSRFAPAKVPVKYCTSAPTRSGSAACPAQITNSLASRHRSRRSPGRHFAHSGNVRSAGGRTRTATRRLTGNVPPATARRSDGDGHVAAHFGPVAPQRPWVQIWRHVRVLQPAHRAILSYSAGYPHFPHNFMHSGASAGQRADEVGKRVLQGNLCIHWAAKRRR